MEARNIFLCGGAISSSALLQRSNVKCAKGKYLQMHQMARILVEYDELINYEGAAIPAVQIAEFKPEATLGASYSSLELMSLASPANYYNYLVKNKERHTLLYCLQTSKTRGKVRNIPIIGETIFYNMSRHDMSMIKKNIERLGEVAFISGAKSIIFRGKHKDIVKCKNQNELQIYLRGDNYVQPEITSIHAFSACRMGKNCESSVVTKEGKVHGYSNLYVADTSVLPSCTGVNPQGTVMAISMMIGELFIAKS